MKSQNKLNLRFLKIHLVAVNRIISYFKRLPVDSRLKVYAFERSYDVMAKLSDGQGSGNPGGNQRMTVFLLTNALTAWANCIFSRF